MSWIDELIPTSYNGIPFLVGETEFRTGRRVDEHMFVQNDNMYPEDLGRKAREYSFTGWTVGDTCYAQAELLVFALEQQGPGLLTHPYKGVKLVQVRDVSMGIRKDVGRVVQINISFVEASALTFPSVIIETASLVRNLASDFADSSNADFDKNVNAITATTDIADSAVFSVQTVVATISAYANDASRSVNAVNGIGFIFPDTITFGRYSNGNLTTTPAALSSVDPSLSIPLRVEAAETALLNAATASLATIEAAASNVSVLLSPLTSDNLSLGLAVRTLFEAFRSADNDQSDAIRLLVQVINSLSDSALPSGQYTQDNAPTGASIYTAMCRQQGIYSLALACASYLPLSSTDANSVLAKVTPIFDYEIQYLGDIGDDATFSQMRTFRAAIVNDLQTRGSTLPALITATRTSSLPPEVVANQIYGDGGRGDELVKRNNPFHPLGLPLSIEALSS